VTSRGNRTTVLPGSLVALAGSVLLLATGCTGGPSGPTAEDAAGDLATALSAGKLAGLRFTGGTPEQAQRLWSTATEGLGGAEPAVTVGRVTEGEDGSPSTARLRYAWTLPGGRGTWSYETTARLSRGADDAWRVAVSPSLVHPRLATGGTLRLTTVQAERANITGAGGATLVKPRPVLRVGIDKAQVPAVRAGASARELARVLDIDPAPYAQQVEAAGGKAFVEALVLRASAPEAEQALRASREIDGAGIVRGTLPLAPTREFARPLLGTVGPVTAEIVQKSDGAYRAGDQAGLSGLEARYDEQLRGTPGAKVSVVDAEGRARQVFSVDPEPGDPLATTLDQRLQSLAERVLSGVRPASALVAVRPSTGDVLAAASGPGGGGLSTATVGRYAPGSTFKVVTSLALLRSGLDPGSTMFCPATTVVDGKRFKNYSDYPASGLGRIPLSAAVANSCNTAFIGERETVTQPELARAAASLGLGVDHDLGFPAYFGEVPATDAEAGSETGHAASLIGQGRVTASPLAMAAVAASVAHGGVVVPRLLPDQATDDVAPAQPVTGAEARRLRSLMRGVVTQGSGRFLASVPGPPVLAKTGTAEFGDAEPLQTHAWMIAVHGDLAVAVFVDVGDSGSGTAGPLLDRFLREAGTP
jgi:cell division protein FtsI/penicillin-binding protein 2